MKGKDGMGRDCRAMGGSAMNRGKNTVMKAAEGGYSPNEPDAKLATGGRTHRRRGGKAEGEYHNAEEGEEKRGGRVHKKKGGMIEGGAKMPHMGRARRAKGGRTADLNPMTHDAGAKPKHRYIQPESENVP